MKTMIRQRKVVVPDFHRVGEPLYEDELGWPLGAKKEAGSLVSKEIFYSQVVEVGLNLSFYYIDNDTFYGIHTEMNPIECKILPRDRNAECVESQCEGDTHADGEVIASFDDEHDIWDGLRIDGKSLEDVLRRSYITGLN